MKKILVIVITLVIISCGSNKKALTLTQHKKLNKAVIEEYPDAGIYWANGANYIVKDGEDVYYIKTIVNEKETLSYKKISHEITPFYARDKATLPRNAIHLLSSHENSIIYNKVDYMLYKGDFYRITVFGNTSSVERSLGTKEKLIKIQ